MEISRHFVMQAVCRFFGLFVIACTLHLLLDGKTVHAVELKPGDILADLIVVKPGTGSQTIAGVQLRDHDGLAFDNAGLLLNIFDGGITTHNLQSREQTTVFPNGIQSSILGLAVANDGRIFAYDMTSVSRIDPATGQQTVLASGNQFNEINSIAIDINGNVLIGDRGNKALFAIDPDNGAVETISSNGGIFNIAAIAIDGNGDYIILNEQASAPDRFLKIDRNSRTQSRAVNGDLTDSQGTSINTSLSTVSDFVIDNNGDYLVAMRQPLGQNAGIFRVDPSTGLTTNLNDERFVILDMLKNGNGEVFFIAQIQDGSGLYHLDQQSGVAEIQIYQGIFSNNIFQAPAAADSDAIYYIQNGIKRLIPTTGKIEDVASGGLLSQPENLVVEHDGNLLVVDGNSNSVIRIDPDTGFQDQIASFDVEFGIADIYLGPNGHLFILPAGILDDSHRIIRVDPANGGVSLMPFSGTPLTNLGALAVEPGGNFILVSGSRIIRLSATTGSHVVIAEGGSSGILIDRPRDLTVSPDGTIYVADSDARAIILIDPVSLVQSELASGGYMPTSGTISKPQVLTLVPGEINSFVGNILTLPAVQVGSNIFRVEMVLLNPQNLTFQVTRGNIITDFDAGNVSIFANNVLTVNKVVIGNTVYSVEMTLTDPGALIFTLTNAVRL